MHTENFFFVKSFGYWGSCSLKQGNPLQHFKNHSQLTNFYFIFINFLVISRSIEFIFDSFNLFLVRSEVPWVKVSSVEAAMAWNRGFPCNILKITHNYLLFYSIVIFYQLYHHFKVQRVDIWFVETIWSNGWGSLGGGVGHWGIYDLEMIRKLIKKL